MKSYHRIALITLILTLGMITLGGVVHNTGSSLACPDWPLCYGQVFPKMEGAVAVEHSHRLLGSLIGLLCMTLVALGFKLRKEDPKLAKISWLALGLVVFQGVLGGATVLLQLSPIVSTLHLASSQIFMGTLLWLTLRSRAGQSTTGTLVPHEVRKWLAITLVAVFVQMLLGAAIRHGGAGVACGLGSDALFLCASTEARSFWPSEAPAQLHMLHRYFAIFTFALVIGGTLPFLKWVKKSAPTNKKLRLLVVACHILVTAQVLLGLLTILTSIAVVPVTLHLVTAVLLCFVLLCLNFLAAGRIAT